MRATENAMRRAGEHARPGTTQNIVKIGERDGQEPLGSLDLELVQLDETDVVLTARMLPNSWC